MARHAFTNQNKLRTALSCRTHRCLPLRCWDNTLRYNLGFRTQAQDFKGSDAYRANPANVDAVSRDFVGLGINVTPIWYQVFPSVDISLPLSWAGGLSGVSAVTSGGAKDNGSYSIGIGADVQSKYSVALRYVGFYGDYSTTPSGAMNVAQSSSASLSDRGHVLFTFKTTF